MRVVVRLTPKLAAARVPPRSARIARPARLSSRLSVSRMQSATPIQTG